VAALEIGGNDGAVLLLSRCVPDVEFSRLFLQSDVLYFEIDGSDLRLFLCDEVSFGEAPEECGLSNIAIPHNDDLVSFLVFVVR
jgi:hypothetical protein